MTVLTEAWRITLGYFGLAIPAGLVCLALWWWWPPPAGKLFPRRRYRPPPWSGFVVLLVFVFTLLWDATAEAVLNVLWGPPAEAEFDDFVAGCFTGREAVFAAAENFVITSKSDGIPIPSGKNALLVMGAKWYAERSAALYAELRKRLDSAASHPR